MKWILAAIVLSSCTLSPGSQNLLRKGMSQAAVHSVLGLEAFASSKIEVPSDPINRYSVDVYVSDEDAIIKKHVFAFRNDSLLYWGLQHEFMRHPSQIINEIGSTSARIQ
ncbi:MAG: hypothetical protein JSS89_06210 [Bacteroidetes bacterium]|nr:hypothetical protein [Bacteroidota bacterium]